MNLKLFLLNLFLVTCGVLLSWRIYSQLHNNLSQNQNWDIGKLQLEKYVNGSSDYYFGRQALAHEKLNLGAWYGYQELVTKSPIEQLSTLSVDFYLTGRSYFDLIYDKNPDSYYIIRVSGNSGYPSALIKTKSSGEFESTTPIKISKLGLYQWHHLTLELNQDQNTTSLTIDNQTIDAVHIPLTGHPVNIGFRGSYQPTYVDNIVAKDINGNTKLFENFSYHDRNILFKLTLIFVAFLGLSAMVYIFHPNRQKLGYLLVVIYLNIIFLLSATSVFLNYRFVDTFPKYDSLVNSVLGKLKLIPVSNPENFAKRMSQEIVNSVIEDSRPRVLFLGTSQTWGAGATKENESYFKVIENLASTKLGNKYQFINAGISGLNSTEVLDYYKESWINLHPKIVVVDLSSNDKDPVAFSRNLEEIVSLNHQKKIKTVFLLEANSPEITTNQRPPLHPVMITLAKKENIRLIDIHQYLVSQINTGNIWWDSVHPTSYGHRLLGQYIFDNIKDLL